MPQPDPLRIAIAQRLIDREARVYTLEADGLHQWRRDQFGIVVREPIDAQVRP